MALLSIFPALAPHPALPARSSPDTATEAYPKDYFRSPIDSPILMSGTFCELRSNHFHSGIDIKSNTGGVGQPVLAAADGYVSRIKVEPAGYGNALYIKHPNGYTTVYAHLDRFMSEVAQYVKDAQYKRESFSVDLNPPEGQFRVKKGQEIGKMGNSGSSSGPHLHFEIRNTATQKALNPFLFGLAVKDQTPPDIRDMKLFLISNGGETLKGKAFPIEKRGAGSYGIKGDTASVGWDRIAFAIKAYDKSDGVSNDNGPHSILLKANGVPIYQWTAEALNFEETRYLNAHIDYGARQRFGAWFHRCFILPGNRLSTMYDRSLGPGHILLNAAGTPTEIELKVADPFGNSAALRFWIRRSETLEDIQDPVWQYEINHQADFNLEMPRFSMSLPKGALYEPLKFRYRTETSTSPSVYSEVHCLHDRETPVHRYFEIAIRPDNLPPELKSKAVIARTGDGLTNCGGKWRGETLTTRVRDFGNYCVTVDDTPPDIKPLAFERDMRKRNAMSFRISDRMPTDAQAKGLYYRATVDGRWVLFEYDRKNNKITHHFDGRIVPGEHRLRIVVRDDRGNERVLERDFVR
ncbi:MAG: M23 family metallopeptidase [Saprospiraceae bacterium]